MSLENEVKFSVKVHSSFDHLFDEFTNVHVTGDNEALGGWIAAKSIPLQKISRESDGSSLWSGFVKISSRTKMDEFRFRYFIGRRFDHDREPFVHVLKWECSPIPRLLKMIDRKETLDEFGGGGDSGEINDGWLCDPKIKEIRFSLLDQMSIRFNKSDNQVPASYKISISVMKIDKEKELVVDNDSIVFVGVLNDEARRKYRKVDDNNTTYATNGSDLLTFRVQASTGIQDLIFRFHVMDNSSNMVLAVADVKLPGSQVMQDTMSVDLFDQSKITAIGKFTVAYLIILPSTPAVLSFCNLEKSYISHWKRRQPLDIGHRGMGNSYIKKARERENTLKSLVTAILKGADFVEFDVQLSKDGVPVLFHDFHVCVEENGQLKEISVKDLTLDQMRSYKLCHSEAVKDVKCNMLVSDPNEEASDPDSHAFPLLKDILDKVPDYGGFNIEIKYPMFTKDGISECDGYFELNLFVDHIIEVVMKHGKSRRIVFSSFCPEICVLLRLKQNRYPVLFLTMGITKRYPLYISIVTTTSELAINFALAEGLLGVSFHSEELLSCPEIIQKACGHGLVSFVWGDDLDDTKNIQFMKKIGLDGIIYDRIDEHTHGKCNIFRK